MAFIIHIRDISVSLFGVLFVSLFDTLKNNIVYTKGVTFGVFNLGRLTHETMGF